MNDIKEQVAAKIVASGPTVKNTVIDKLAQVEINKRVGIIEQAVGKLESLEKELKKIDGQNDIKTYTGGTKVESMSEKRFQEIEKAKKAFADFKTAFDATLETNTQESYNKLNGLIGANKEQSKGESTAST